MKPDSECGGGLASRCRGGVRLAVVVAEVDGAGEGREVGVLVLGVLAGLLLAVALSIAALLSHMSRPSGSVLGRPCPTSGPRCPGDEDAWITRTG